MKLTNFIVLSLICIGFISCKKESPTNKVIDGLPIKSGEVVVPAYAVQEMMFLRKNLIRSIIFILNKTTIANPTYPELGGTGPYTLAVEETRIGASLTYTIEFFDIANASIDPISTQSSSATIKSVNFVKTAGGGSTLFPTLSDSGTLTLDTTNYAPDATIRLSGTMVLTNSSYSIPLTMGTPGGRVNTEGLREGAVTVTSGTGLNGTDVTMSLGVSNDHSIDGNIAWDGQEGSLHISNSGSGFVITSDARIPIN